MLHHYPTRFTVVREITITVSHNFLLSHLSYMQLALLSNYESILWLYNLYIELQYLTHIITSNILQCQFNYKTKIHNS